MELYSSLFGHYLAILCHKPPTIQHTRFLPQPRSLAFTRTSFGCYLCCTTPSVAPTMAAAASSSTDAAMAAAAAAGAAAAGGDGATAVRELDPIELPVTPIDINFHPQQDVIAVGLVDGLVQLYKYSPDGNKLLANIRNHTESCRALQFTPTGAGMFSASADKSLYAVNTAAAVVWEQKLAHAHAINSLLCFDERSLMSGDDEGVVKIWDTRSKKCVQQYAANEDVITDFAINDAHKTLLAASGDGTLSVFDLAAGKLQARSDQCEDEFLSLAIIKGGKKVIVGTQGGVLNVYSWGHWADLDDRYPGHPDSVDTMLAVDADTVATGSEDGLIRLVQVQPNKLLGVIGEHGEDPIERIQFSRDKQYLASCSHDNTVKFIDIAFLFEDDGDDDDDDDDAISDDDDGDAAAAAAASSSSASSSAAAGAVGGGAGGGAGASASVAPPPPPSRSERLKPKSDAQKFFSDL